MTSKLQLWVQLVCVSAILVVGAVPAGAGVSDAWVSTKVKMLLLNSPAVSGFPIDVDTDGGRVTLHGKVPSATEKKEAERIARAGTGVVSVRNLLQIVPESQRKLVNVTDEYLKDQVAAALKAEPWLDDTSIRTKSVNKGVVLLEGKAATLSDHLRALEVTSSVPGVRQVASEIVSPDEFGDREIWNDATPADSEHGNAFTDGWITAQTKMALMTDSEIISGDINVDTHRGIVTLFGTAPTRATLDRAIVLAKEVSGVRSVNPELRVVAASKKKQATANDSQIKSAVNQRIAAVKMEGARVNVEVNAATVRLTGTVQQASHRYAAVAIAHGTPGVARVHNDLLISVNHTRQR
jgi:osmotically-inducible protein OsmY